MRSILFGAAFFVGATAVLTYNTVLLDESVTLSVGQVASADVLAPYSLSYESVVLTRLARQTASDSVAKIYDPPNPAILRQQIQIARDALDFVANVRLDSYATREQQLDDLTAMQSVKLPRDTYALILDLDPLAWKDIDAQVMLTLERAMRNVIREDNLQSLYAGLPNLVGLSVTQTQADLTVAFVSQLVRPNSFFNEAQTRDARDARALAVLPVVRGFVEGQIVVRAGTVISEADVEALTQFRLLQSPSQRLRGILGGMLAVALIGMVTILFIRRFAPNLMGEPGRLTFIAALFLIFLSGSRLYDVADPLLASLYPAAAFTLIIAGITSTSVAVGFTGALAALVGLMLGQSLEHTVLVALGGVAGVLTLRHAERLNAYFAAGLVIGIVNVTVGLMFGLGWLDAEPIQALMAALGGLISGVLAAGIGLVGLYVASHLLNLPTSIKLLELAQPNQPILGRLLREAPGTYQHSLQVANLAELAAERIGANAPLLRVAALYHDIGKLHGPLYFVENQAEGVNPHHDLPPEESARLIIAHVIEGEKLARKNGLPTLFVDLICQHHGTTRVLYFYNKALEAADGDASKVDMRTYTYPGPRPQTREAGILMLADSCESTVRAKHARDKVEIAQTVSEIMQARLNAGQLDDTGLTVDNLRVLNEVFVSSLQGVFHPRIAYPTSLRMTQEIPVFGNDESRALAGERNT
jgi:hypothetical protein